MRNFRWLAWSEPAWQGRLLIFFTAFSEKADEKFAVFRGEVVGEYRLLYQRLQWLIGILLELGGDPFDGLAQLFTIGQQSTHVFSPLLWGRGHLILNVPDAVVSIGKFGLQFGLVFPYGQTAATFLHQHFEVQASQRQLPPSLLLLFR